MDCMLYREISFFPVHLRHRLRRTRKKGYFSHALKVAIPFFNAYIERYQEKPAENITEIETTNEVTGDVHTETSMIPSSQTEVEADHENKLTSTKYCYK